jgi:hypothetical protein
VLSITNVGTAILSGVEYVGAECTLSG